MPWYIVIDNSQSCKHSTSYFISLYEHVHVKHTLNEVGQLHSHLDTSSIACSEGKEKVPHYVILVESLVVWFVKTHRGLKNVKKSQVENKALENRVTRVCDFDMR